MLRGSTSRPVRSATCRSDSSCAVNKLFVTWSCLAAPIYALLCAWCASWTARRAAVCCSSRRRVPSIRMSSPTATRTGLPTPRNGAQPREASSSAARRFFHRNEHQRSQHREQVHRVSTEVTYLRAFAAFIPDYAVAVLLPYRERSTPGV